MKARLLKPSFIVGLSSTIRGGISYNREDLGNVHENGSEISKWKTTRTIDDKEEYERAVKARGKAVSLIRGVCNTSRHYLFCPFEREKELDEAIEEAKKVVRETNEELTFSRIDVFPLKLEFVNNEKEVIRALSAEVTQLIEDMQVGINNLSATDIRTAANRAREIMGTLEDSQAQVLNDAIKEARRAARMFIKRVEKEGEKAETVLAEVKRNELEKARVAFLDYSEEVEEIESLPIAPQQRVANLDISDDSEEMKAQSAA